MKRKNNQKRRTPIPRLANHIAAFNAGKITKHELADVIAAVADRAHSLSYRERKITQ